MYISFLVETHITSKDTDIDWNLGIKKSCSIQMAGIKTGVAILVPNKINVIFGMLLFSLNIYILLKYSWLSVFHVNSKVIWLYSIDIHCFFRLCIHYRLLQHVDYASLCCTGNLCCLFAYLFLFIKNLAFYLY